MSEIPRHLPANIVLPVEQMSGSQMSEPFAWLTGHVIDSLVVDERRLLSVDHRFEGQDGTLHVLCTDDEGATHMFEYDPTDNADPVRHVLLGIDYAD